MNYLSRRKFIVLSTAAGASLLTGCGARLKAASPTTAIELPAERFSWLEAEKPIIETIREDFDIVVRGSKNAVVLRTAARSVPAGFDLQPVSARMEKTMLEARGVGLAGPQVGLRLRIATLMLDYKAETPQLIFVRNPVIVERSDETIDGYEGCLSVPGVGAMVRRNKWIKVEHETIEGETVSTQAEGYNAVLWQHELDHLDGILYLDKLLGELMPMEEVRRLRKELEAKQKGLG